MELPTFDKFISGDLPKIQIGVTGTEKELFKYVVLINQLNFSLIKIVFQNRSQISFFPNIL